VRELSKNNWALCQVPRLKALCGVKSSTGAIIALQGGFDFYNSKYNRATQSKRQPGSGFKRLFIPTALENGFTPSSTIVDAQITIRDPNLKHGCDPKTTVTVFTARLLFGMVKKIP